MGKIVLNQVEFGVYFLSLCLFIIVLPFCYCSLLYPLIMALNLIIEKKKN